jgi:hypothetical protein
MSAKTRILACLVIANGQVESLAMSTQLAVTMVLAIHAAITFGVGVVSNILEILLLSRNLVVSNYMTMMIDAVVVVQRFFNVRTTRCQPIGMRHRD